MQIGKYKGKKALLWNNSSDTFHKKAIQELRFKKNNIKVLSIMLNEEPTYSTHVVAQWFLKQTYACGEQITHKLNKNNQVISTTSYHPYRWRHLVTSMEIITPDGISHWFTQKQYYEYNELIRHFFGYWEPEELPSLPQNTDIDEFNTHPLFEELLRAYDLTADYIDQLDAYIQNKFPIQFLPHDEVVYEWFCQLGIAPRQSLLDDPNQNYLIDPEEITLVGKETILDDTDYLDEIPF